MGEMSATVTNWGSATSTGLVRRNNEDVVFADFPVFVVADGMGGAAAGEVAAALASEAFHQLAGVELSVDDVSQAIGRANQSVVDTARAREECAGMGTTLVGLALVNNGETDVWFAFNVGDSRLYRYFEGALQQVSTDHTEVQVLVDRGLISAEEARSNPHRHVITRVIGVDTTVQPDIWLLTPVAGERFVICSDGLTGDVEDDRIAGVLATETDATGAAQRLVEIAVAAGGHDNVSVVVVDVLSVAGADDAATADGEGDGAVVDGEGATGR
jgi:serine/threonine protein phosphatase PrpC